MTSKKARTDLMTTTTMPKQFRAEFHSSTSPTSRRLKPAVTYSIPSSHDGLQLDGRIYGASVGDKVAVVAHPYAPLGGSWDDPVVMTVVSALLGKGYLVGTFNFRGAGRSKGRTSWSSHPETMDYSTIASFLILYSLYSQPDTSKLEVVLAGYSYGSLVASQVPAASSLIKDASLDVRTFAQHTARGKDVTLSALPSGEWRDENSPETDMKITEINDVDTTTSYILSSPLLPPISTLLSIMSGPKAVMSSISSLWSTPSQEPTHQDETTHHKTLAIYGTNDMFVSISKLRSWTQRKKKEVGELFTAVEVKDATHFWMDQEDHAEGPMALELVHDAVEGWVAGGEEWWKGGRVAVT